MPGRIGVEPGDHFPGTLGEGDGGGKVGNQPLDLGVVKDHAVGLVTEETRPQLGIESGYHIRGHVHDLRFDPRGMGQEGTDLVPGEYLVGCDVEGMADSVVVAQ